MNKSLLVISNVLPYPGSSGQQQRVRNKLLAFRDFFQTTFMTVAASEDVDDVKHHLEPLCDETVVLPSLYHQSGLHRLWYLAKSSGYAAITGLKRSNFVVGNLEFSPNRLSDAVGDRRYDVVVFEYWHAAAGVPQIQKTGARCVLDMHDVLWRSYERQLGSKSWLPSVIRGREVSRYRAREEEAWRRFDALVTINREEHGYVSKVLGDGSKLFFTPMGVNLEHWPFAWSPVKPPRIAFFGGLGSRHNQQDAWFCLKRIMPCVWSSVPDAEYWIVGSNPPQALVDLARRDERIHVTGFVEDVGTVLRSMSVVLCPWQGRFGFRSRVVETQAIGVPVVATSEAVDGMGLRADADFLVANTGMQMAEAVVTLVGDRDLSARISRSARQRVEELYSFEATYGKLALDLHEWSDEIEIERSQHIATRPEKSDVTHR